MKADLEMINVAVYDKEGLEVEKLKVDKSLFGDKVRYPLLKQAIVMHQANKRVGTAATKGRSMVSGSGKKLFRQKGTGFARVGNRRTGKRVGGGVTFAKVSRDFSKRMPKKQRRLAINSAVLAKLLGGNVIVIDELFFEKPCTRDFVGVLGNLKIDRGCVVTLKEYNENVYKSARNVPGITILPLAELNASDICSRGKIMFTKDAFLGLLDKQKADKN
ncbi:MAG: 50S ribosomal protein L4 [Planctomycetota bacterium]|jgi:large subunit ribosomal protein L4